MLQWIFACKFGEIYVPRAWRVYLTTGFDFCEKKLCLFWVDRNPSLLSASYLATLLWKKDDESYFSQKLSVCIKDNNKSSHGKFHQFLFPFSSKFSDLNFTSYVLYICLCCVMCHTKWAWVTYLCSYPDIFESATFSFRVQKFPC